MRISDFKKPALSGIVFFGTVVALSVGYAALNGGISASDKVSSNETLSATKWNRIVDGVLDLDARTAGMTTNGGNVGIGTISPTAKLDLAGNFKVSAIASRILWDFSDLTVSNRLLFQTSVANQPTGVGIIPNGTSSVSSIQVFNSSTDPSNSSYGALTTTSWLVILDSNKIGDGVYLPLMLRTGNAERVRIDTLGNVGIGTASPQKKLDVSGDIAISSNKYLWSSPNSGTNVGQIKLHDSTTGNMEFTKIWGGNFVFSGWNVVMWYEIITNDIASGAVVGWYYASCPSGKVVLGGSCSTGAGTQPTNTSISGNGYGCYKSNTTTNWQIKATCANMQ